VELNHLAPTRVGGHVAASARLVEVVARNLMFEFSVSDERTEVANGTHRRVIVDRAHFLGSLG
jgi:fluoroacetyl-CoA thioesterase